MIYLKKLEPKLSIFKNLKPVISIDGTASSGKGTLAKQLSLKINFDHLDSGILYRYLAYMNLKNINNQDKIKNILKEKIDLKQIKNISINKLRTEKVSKKASQIAQLIETRNFLVDFQRNFANFPPGGKGSIIDGRDIGSVIIPNAEVKFFIDADVNVRAQRRFIDLKKKYEYEKILSELLERDKRDKTRKIAPLKMTKKSIVIDTTRLSSQEVLKIALSKVKNILKIKTN